jgi:hypothetical protein
MMFIKFLQILTLLLMAIALMPSGAHFFELPHKIALSRDHYFIVQGIYAGWSWFGVVLIPLIIADFVLAYLLRQDQWPALLTLVAGILTLATLVIFFIWIFPANQATANWTEIPENWATLRSQWEYTHAVNAVVMLLAFIALALALVMRR